MRPIRDCAAPLLCGTPAAGLSRAFDVAVVVEDEPPNAGACTMIEPRYGPVVAVAGDCAQSGAIFDDQEALERWLKRIPRLSDFLGLI